MKTIDLVGKSGCAYSVDVPSMKEGVKGGYLFAYAKSGSTLLDRMVRQYCKRIGVPSFSLFGQAFSKGVHPTEVMGDSLVCFESNGCVYTGFRHYPVNFDLDTESRKVVLLVRDPRDMLVSLYYSPDSRAKCNFSNLS